MLVTGQVLINSVPLIIFITVGFYTAFCNMRTKNLLPSQKCTQLKWQQKWSKVVSFYALFYSACSVHHPRPVHSPWCCLESWSLVAAATSTDPEPWAASLTLCGCLTLYPGVARTLPLLCCCLVGTDVSPKYEGYGGKFQSRGLKASETIPLPFSLWRDS